MQKVRVGIIGAGWVVRNRHLPALCSIPGVECRLICSLRLENARNVAAQFGIKEVAESWQQICDSPDLDAVVVATPPNLHCAATVRALQAGKHVLCQGRMARNLSEALDMIRAARSSGLVTALYPPLPGLRGDRVMKRLLHDGFVGDVREVRVAGMAPAHNKPGDDWKRDSDLPLNITRPTLCASPSRKRYIRR